MVFQLYRASSVEQPIVLCLHCFAHQYPKVQARKPDPQLVILPLGQLLRGLRMVPWL